MTVMFVWLPPLMTCRQPQGHAVQWIIIIANILLPVIGFKGGVVNIKVRHCIEGLRSGFNTEPKYHGFKCLGSKA